VFGNRGAGLAGWSNHKLRFDRLVDAAAGRQLAQWRLHDLRRTTSTRLGKLGVAPHVIDAVLNHVKPKLHRTYNTETYASEKRAALALWAEALLALVEGREAKVLPLPKRA
jgi:hypothetical protein